MGDMLGTWITGLVSASVITAISMTISPEGRVKKVLSLVCGLMMIIVMIKPVVGFDYTTFSSTYFGLKAEAEGFSDELEEVNKNLTGLIIEEQCQAYILDKGNELGIDNLAVTVSARWSEDGYWYPAGAEIITDAGESAKSKLGYCIESDLGIPAEELIWRMNDEE